MNLARKQGVAKGADTVLTQLTLSSKATQTAPFKLGFSDDAKLYLNGKLLFAASDRYCTRDYRFLGTVGLWDTILLPLNAGEKTLTVAVAESFTDKTGWAIMGQFDPANGISWK